MIEEEIQTAASEVLPCDLLAQTFLEGPVQLDAEANALWERYLCEAPAVVGKSWHEAQQALNDSGGPERVWADFRHCVQVPVPTHYVPAYASCYLDKPAVIWGPTTYWVLARYEESGLDWQAHHHVVAPDHAAVEWAFLAELGARMNPQDRQTRQRFVSEHMLKWFPLFLEPLQQAVSTPYYPALGRLGLAWLKRAAHKEEIVGGTT